MRYLRLGKNFSCVPQGSILGPYIFLLFITDIACEINSNIRLFADDTTIYIIVDFLDSIAQILNIDLEHIVHCAAMWLVNLILIKMRQC